MRSVPAVCVTLVKRFEGFHRVVRPGVAVPYLCPAGFWTRGYGILCDADAGEITLAEAEAELAAYLPKYLAHAFRLSPGLASESDERLAAITSFIFNLGPGRYAASTLRRRVNAKDWAAAAVEIKRWVRGGGRVLPGLVVRRQAESNLLA